MSTVTRDARKRARRTAQTDRTALAPGASLSELLGRIHCRGKRTHVLLACGPELATTSDLREYGRELVLPAGWELVAERVNSGTARWDFRAAGGERVTVEPAAALFGPQSGASPAAIGASWDRLAAQLALAGLPDLLTTPAAIGRELLLRSLPEGQTFESAGDDLGQLIRATSPQGRIEVLPRPDSEPLGALHVFDMRLAYAAVTRELPAGPAEHDTRSDFDPYARGRYRVRVTVPADWADRHPRIGLLPHKMDSGSGWEYPSEPGRTFETWCDGAELRIAATYGWSFDVRERIVWPRRGDPLRNWSRKLIEREARTDDPRVRYALRSIVRHSIGAMHSPFTRVNQSAPAEVGPSAGADNPRMVDGQWHWVEYRAHQWPQLARPEWSAAIYARCRTRLLSHRQHGCAVGALHVPAESVVAMRTDALWLTAEPGWTEPAGCGEVGHYRHARSVELPDTPWPRNGGELLRLATDTKSADA